MVTSEQLAVEKFKEELKDKIQDIDIWHKNGLQLKKEILKLLE